MSRTSVSIALSGIACFLLAVHWSDAVIEMAEVKCRLMVNYTEAFYKAYSSCFDKMRKELMKVDLKEMKGRLFPHNATDEEFEWDDKCFEHCVYEEAGLIEKDSGLPKESETEKIFTKGKVAAEFYMGIVSAWNSCLEISGKIGKAKGFDNCKLITHHRHCFNKKQLDAMSVEVECSTKTLQPSD